MSMNLCMPSGLSLDPTTAGASDILNGKTAYNGEGNLLTGTMMNNGRWPNADKVTFEKSKIWMYKSDGYTEGGLGAEGSTFGNASASDVRSGLTFTSQNGLKLTGTMNIAASLKSKTISTGNIDGNYTYTVTEGTLIGLTTVQVHHWYESNSALMNSYISGNTIHIDTAFAGGTFHDYAFTFVYI